MEPPAEAELIKRAQDGDSDAFATLCERSRARLWRVAASIADGRDAEDLAQEAILRAWAALPGYRAEASFEAWLCRIALNAAHDCRRSAWRRRVLLFPWTRDDGPADPEPIDAAVARRESLRRVREAVAALPEHQRVPIWLHYFEDFSVAEIARLEKQAESTIRSRVRAGLQRLEKALRGMPEVVGEGRLMLNADPEACQV